MITDQKTQNNHSAKNDFEKIRVTYPDGTVDCDEKVTKTYRRALRYMGLQKVRDVGIIRNTINIVSTPDEISKSEGGKKESENLLVEDGLCICSQFNTRDKYRYLTELNDKLKAGLVISLAEGGGLISIPDTAADDQQMEGLQREYTARRYERNPQARKLCLEHYGNKCVCQICGFDFEKVYGKRENAEPYIEVHHINPLSLLSKSGRHYVDCKRDLIPLCSNCHSMIHNLKKHLLMPDELRAILREQSEKNKAAES